MNDTHSNFNPDGSRVCIRRATERSHVKPFVPDPNVETHDEFVARRRRGRLESLAVLLAFVIAVFVFLIVRG